MRVSVRCVVPGIAIVFALSLAARGEDAPAKDPWIGKYPMSFFTKTRTAKTVGEKHLSLALKLQSVDCNEIMQDGCYDDLSDTEKNDKFKAVITAKYGWMKGHHVGLGIPYLWTDFKSSKADIDSDSLGNIFIFEKWNLVPEGHRMPGVAVDVWYFFPTGDTDKKLGTDDSSIRLTAEISKAWKYANVHLNPAYTWNLDDGCDIEEINTGAFFPVHKKAFPGIEYNYTSKTQGKGHCHDLVPGILWKPRKNASVKLGAVVNLDSTMKYRDELGWVAKLFYKF